MAGNRPRTMRFDREVLDRRYSKWHGNSVKPAESPSLTLTCNSTDLPGLAVSDGVTLISSVVESSNHFGKLGQIFYQPSVLPGDVS